MTDSEHIDALIEQIRDLQKEYHILQADMEILKIRARHVGSVARRHGAEYRVRVDVLDSLLSVTKDES